MRWIQTLWMLLISSIQAARAAEAKKRQLDEQLKRSTTMLKELELDLNDLTGTIPSSFTRLTGLTVLYL